MNNINRLYRRRIGDILLAEGVITSSQLEEALAIQRRTGELLGAILLDMKLVTEAEIAKTICMQYQLPFLSLANYDYDQKLVNLFPKEFLAAHRILPFDKVGDTLLVMIAEVPGEDILTEIPRITKVSSAALYVGLLSEVEHELSRLLGLPKLERSSTRVPAGKAQEPPSGGKAPPQEPRAKQAVSAAADSDSALDPDVAKLLELRDEAQMLVAALGEETEDSPEDADLPDEDSEEADGSGEPDENGDEASEREPQTLVLGESAESFLRALDSTWDSIFPGAPSEDEGA